MSAEEPAEPKAVKHTLDAPGSPPAAKKARAEDLKTEDTLADAEESAAAAPPAGGDAPEPAEPAPDAGGDDAGSEAGEAPGDASEGGEPPAPDAAGAAAAAVAAASGALAPSSPDGMPRPGMGVMAAPPMAPMAQYTLQALAGRTIEFKVLLPNAKCGIVIGKGGAMIKHIRETSKAQVDVSEAQAVSAHVAAAQGGAGLAAERVVSFSGDFGAVYAAFQMVLSHIVANSPAVVDALGVAMPAVGGVVEAVVLVPRNKTGGLIGRAGASINRVRQDSGATVKVGAPEDVVVGDPDVRKCVVSGSIDQVMGAFTLIVHKLEETPAGAARAPEMGGMGMPGYGMAVPGMPPGQFPPGGPGGPGGPGMAPPLAPGTMPVQFQVPNESMGAVIGRAGATINQIRQMSQAKVDIAQSVPGMPMRLVTVTGTPDQIQMAQYLIQVKMGGGSLPQAGQMAAGGAAGPPADYAQMQQQQMQQQQAALQQAHLQQQMSANYAQGDYAQQMQMQQQMMQQQQMQQQQMQQQQGYQGMGGYPAF